MRNFSKVVLFGIFSSVLCNPVKADYDYYSLKNTGRGGIEVYTCVDSIGGCTRKGTYSTGLSGWNAGTGYVDKKNNLIIHGLAAGGGSKGLKYDAKTEAIKVSDDWGDDMGSPTWRNRILRFSFEEINMPDEGERMGLYGIGAYDRFNPWLYGGILPGREWTPWRILYWWLHLRCGKYIKQ